jgi:small subunit ribosomal protein S20
LLIKILLIDKSIKNRHSRASFYIHQEIKVLANSPQAKKRARQAEKNRQHNVHFRSTMRTQIKRVLKAIEDGDKEAAGSAFKAAIPSIDSTSNKGLIHRNKAARHKNRLNKAIRAMG